MKQVGPVAGIVPILGTSYDEADRIAVEDIAAQVTHLAGLGVAAVLLDDLGMLCPNWSPLA